LRHDSSPARHRLLLHIFVFFFLLGFQVTPQKEFLRRERGFLSQKRAMNDKNLHLRASLS